MKNILLVISVLLFTIISCSEDASIVEITIDESKIEIPFEEREDGRFLSIYRNQSEETVPISILMVSNQEILENSQNLDFCEGVNAYRSGKIIKEWVVINHNFPLIPEKIVENQNDHPNLFSSNFPKGTYLVMLMDVDSCTKDNYVIFDVKKNANFGGN